MDFFNKKIIYVILFFTIGLYFAFGFFHLSKFVTTDEQFWIYDRIPQYWHGITELKFKKTHINDKPGVTLALISGIGLAWDAEPENHKLEKTENLDSYQVGYTEKLYTLFRLPIFIFNGLFLIYLFWIIKKISNEQIALWSTILTALSPFLLGISRIINPDALLWSFTSAAIFSYFALLKHHEKKFVLLTALFTGLALATKYVANILFPFFFVSIFIFYFFDSEKGKPSLNFIKTNLLNFLLIFFGSIVVFSLLMPAVFIKPLFLWEGTLGFSGMRPLVIPMALTILLILADIYTNAGRIIGYLLNFFYRYKKVISIAIFGIAFVLFSLTTLNWMLSEKIIDLSHIPIDSRDDPKFVQGANILDKMLLESFPLVFTLTPLSLLLILFAWGKNIFSKKELPSNELVLGATVFIIIFLFGGIFSGILMTPRYLVSLFPLAAFISGIGIFYLSNQKNINHLKSITLISSSLLIILSCLSLWSIKPFYYNYTSSLLPSKYITNNAWGFGGYEASEYLNNLPGSENLTVWTDYRGTCEFFKGKCILGRTVGSVGEADYFVLTRRGQSRSDFSFANYLEKLEKKPEWELFIGDRPENFIKIYKK